MKKNFLLILSSFLFSINCLAYDLDYDSKGLHLKYQKTSLTLSGRAQLDRTIVNEDITPFEDDTDFRRLRIKTQIKHGDRIKLAYSYDFEAEATRDAFLAYKYNDKFSVVVGQLKRGISLERRASSNWFTFVERSPFIDTATSDRGLGLGLTYNNDKFFFNGTSSTKRVDDSADGRYPFNFGFNFSYRPILKEREVLHIGFSGERNITDDSDSFSLSTESSSRSNANSNFFSGTIDGVQNLWTFNSELAYIKNSFHLSSEFLVLTYNNSASDRREAYGWTASAGYFLNGGSESYNKGKATFGTPNLSSSKLGTWQVAARYHYFDESFNHLNETSLALNYYPNLNLRFSLQGNYSRLQQAEEPDEELLGLQLRAQLAFR